MCYGKHKHMCLWHVNIVLWNQNMKQFHSSHGSQPCDFVTHWCSMSFWCLFTGQIFPVLVKKIHNYKWSYCWGRAEEWGNKNATHKHHWCKIWFFKMLFNTSSMEWDVTCVCMVLTKLFILLKCNLTFCINYDFEIVIYCCSVRLLWVVSSWHAQE